MPKDTSSMDVWRMSLIAAPTLRDWRTCCLSVSDDLGEEIFVLPFSSIIGKPH
jgi:hypothetical protein